MACSFLPQLLKDTVSFHGHSCPGLAIGIRVAEYALKEFQETDPEKLVCVTETDMCGVDGIQFLTGCTFGKGNLIHLDYGKAAFSFYSSESGRGIRLVLKDDEQKRDRQEMITHLMQAELEELFDSQEPQRKQPSSARILKSLVGESCREKTMESRTRRFDSKTLCIPCFNKVEQKT